jgi:CRP/FNR family transcriptional regulator, anaerobic regulatory protein
MKSTFLGKVYRDGDVICRQGELSDCLYVIQDGKVEALHRDAEREFCFGIMEMGDFFGESTLLEGELLAATYRAVGDVCVLTIDKKMFLQRMHEDPSFSIKVLRKICRRVRTLETLLSRAATAVPAAAPEPALASKAGA